MKFAEFAHAHPELGKLGTERLDVPGLLLLATLRPNGWPRVSPVEALVCDGELGVSMMWRSQKALDLLREPRCTLHSIVTTKTGAEGDFKLYARARAVHDLDARARYADAQFARIAWRPTEPEFHLFVFDVVSVGYTVFDNGKMTRMAWTAPQA